jgi:hypothetical protein
LHNKEAVDPCNKDLLAAILIQLLTKAAADLEIRGGIPLAQGCKQYSVWQRQPSQQEI